MKKILFFLILLPALVALGHDIYLCTQAPQKGFILSDLGALWDKYHKESHDQWKVKLKELSEMVHLLAPPTDQPASYSAESANVNLDLPQESYLETFQQADGKDAENIIAARQAQGFGRGEAGILQKTFGFVLEQKAVFVFSAFAASLYFLNLLFLLLGRKKAHEDNFIKFKKKKFKKNKKKGATYEYARK